jgi:tetratricopeptide (TPR) repeat protein
VLDSRIFISYRHADSAAYAGRLYDRLKDRYGDEQVFRDLDMDIGIDFVERIDDTVSSCAVMVVIIGLGWLDARDAAGNRRLDDADDYVRVEVSSALKRSMRVIPVLVGDAKMPDKNDLPEPLRALARRNALAISDSRWDYDVGLLMQAVDSVLQEREAQVATDEASNSVVTQLPPSPTPATPPASPTPETRGPERESVPPPANETDPDGKQVTKRTREDQDVAALARRHIAEGRLQDATQVLERHLASAPDDHVARGLLGIAAFDAGDYAKAEVVYREQASLPRPEPRALFRLGVTLERQGRIGDARHWIGAAVEADPAFTEARNALARLTPASASPPHSPQQRTPVGVPRARSVEPTVRSWPLRPALTAVVAAALAAGPAFLLARHWVYGSFDVHKSSPSWEPAVRRASYQGAYWAVIAAVVAVCVAVATRHRTPARALPKGLVVGAVVGTLAGALDQELTKLLHPNAPHPGQVHAEGFLVSLTLVGGLLGASGVIGRRGLTAAVGGLSGGALAGLLATQIHTAFAGLLAAAVLIIAGIWAPELLRLRTAGPLPSEQPAVPLGRTRSPTTGTPGKGKSQFELPGNEDE